MYLLIPAAGSGRRMGADRNKLLLTVQGQTILSLTLKAADQAQSITAIGIIGQPQDEPDWIQMLNDLHLSTPVSLIHGGDTRQESVYRGVSYLQRQPQPPEFVLIHDGARCLATAQLFDRCSVFLQNSGSPTQGMVAAIPVKDTIKLATPANLSTGSLTVESTPDRSRLWAAQTPQGFPLDALLKAHEQAIQSSWEVTDDAALFEKMGWEVAIVEGEETNIKLTTPLDKLLAEHILANRN